MLPVLLAVLSASTVCDAATHETASAIYEGARTRWTTSSYPYDVHYVVRVAYRLDGRIHDVRYAGHARPSTGTFAVDSTSFEERAAPLTPHGINVVIALGGRTVKDLSAPLPGYDAIGIPQLTPVYSFGLARESRDSGAGNAAAATDAAPHTIARVAATRKTYEISCIDSTVRADGVRVNHLGLAPLRDPNDNRLRELWVESGTYWTQAALVARNFVDGPGLQSAWMIDFDHDGSGERIRVERALAPLSFKRKTYEDFALTFELAETPPRTALDTFLFVDPYLNPVKTLREP